MLFESGQKIVFIGDSITDTGRRGPSIPYGAGYVDQVRSFIMARYRERRLNFVNRGVNGDTTRNLLARWQTDVIAEQPDWLSLMIGINDVWRAFGGDAHQAVSLDEYAENLRHLIELTAVKTNARLILLTPYMIEPQRQNPMRAQMDRFGDVVKSVAGEASTLLVDTQQAFDDALRNTTSRDWASDKVHPNGPGHAVIALAFLRAAGFEL